MSRHRFAIFACTALFLAGCASAGKRLEQGQQLELQGRYEAAVTRYAQALEKDPTLDVARTRLFEVGNAAVDQRLADSQQWSARRDPIAAARQYAYVDASVARARGVGVALQIPANYETRRRSAFDAAIETLEERAELAAQQRRWATGIECYQQLRLEFEPSAEQASAALSDEAALLVDWSHENLEAGRLRAAYDVAARVQELEWSPAATQHEAQAVMAHALERGQVGLLVLPMMSQRRRHEPLRQPLSSRINDRLLSETWQQPSPFIRITDPGSVRDLARYLGGLDNEFRAPALVALLKLSDSEYGAWLQLLKVDQTEFDVKRTPQTSQTRHGKTASIVLEEGQRRLQAQARVVVVDHRGNQLTDVVLAGKGSAPFRRGLYDGDPNDLNLSRQQLEWFDPVAMAAQEQKALEALAADLCDKLGAAVLDPVLATIP